MRKPVFCICENKDAHQLRGNREADQRLCFRYIDSAIPLVPKYEISSLWPYSYVVVQPGLCRTWSETPKTGFLTTRLILSGGRNDSMDTLLKNEVLSQNYCVNVLCELLIICGLLTLNIRACHCSGVAEIMRYI